MRLKIGVLHLAAIVHKTGDAISHLSTTNRCNNCVDNSILEQCRVHYDFELRLVHFDVDDFFDIGVYDLLSYLQSQRRI